MAEDPIFEKAMQRAFRLLALRGRSTKEIRSKLRERGFEEPVVRRVIANLLKRRYLDDAACAREWARHLAVNRLYGSRRIENSLREKGISSEIIREALASIREERPERAVLETLLGKKLKGRRVGELDGKEKKRLAQNLMGKGFPAGLIFEVLRIQEEGSFDERE
jgi:regulatory protein